MGGAGYSVPRLEEADSVLDAACAAEGPVVIEAVVDPYEPKMPPDHARKFRKALPETPGHDDMEANVTEEPLRSMVAAAEDG